MGRYVREYLKIELIDVNSSGYRMEARVGIEPTNEGLAGPLRSLPESITCRDDHSDCLGKVGRVRASLLGAGPLQISGLGHAVADPVHGGDVGGLLRVVAQLVTQLLDVGPNYP